MIIPIISFSLDKKMLEDLLMLERELGFSNRSDAIRAALRALVAESRFRKGLSGKIKAVLLVVHSQEAESEANSSKHQFDDIIKTQVHSDMGNGKCLEVFIMDGDAARINEFVDLMQANKNVDSLKLAIP